MATSSGPTERDTPYDIQFDSIVVDLCFHPHKDVIAAGDIDGDIKLFSYSVTEENHNVMEFVHHKKACRCVRFSPDGTKLYSGSKDKSLCVVDLDKGNLSQHIKKAHSSPMYSMYVVDDNILATGDDDGNLKVWDMRQQKSVMDVKECEEFISDMIVGENRRLLLATSGEGTLTAFDIRKHKMKLQSEQFESELLSLAIMKNGEKVVCGSGEGALNIFNWGEWGNISDRFPGHPMSIDCMTALNDDILFTGSFDGNVRAVNIHPNRFLGVVGGHGDFPVENMSLSRCKTYLASCSHDQKICFWNVRDIDKEKVDTKRKAKKSNKPRMLNRAIAKDDFFAGLEEPPSNKNDEDDDEEGDESSDDDNDDGDATKNVDGVDNKDDDNDDDKDSEESDDDLDCDDEDLELTALSESSSSGDDEEGDP